MMTFCTRIISNSAVSRFVSGNPRAMFLFRKSYFSRSSVERLFYWAHVDNNIICSLYRFSDKRGRDSGRKPEEIVQKNNSRSTANPCRARGVLSTAHPACPSHTRQCAKFMKFQSTLMLASNICVMSLQKCQQPSSRRVSLILKELKIANDPSNEQRISPQAFGGLFVGETPVRTVDWS